MTRETGIALSGGNWSAAGKALLDQEWKDLKHEASNAITAYLTKRHPTAYQGVWNGFVREVTGEMVPIVERALAAVPEEAHEAVRSGARWDLLMCVMESSYAQFGVPVFYRRLLTVYLAGHRPCGWDADTNGGTLIVF